MRIELNEVILSPRLSDFLRNSTIHFHIFIFGNMFAVGHGFVAVPVGGHKLEQFRLHSLIRYG